jgi:hypothetical protein
MVNTNRSGVVVDGNNRRNLEEIKRSVEASLRGYGESREGGDRVPLAPIEAVSGSTEEQDQNSHRAGDTGKQTNGTGGFPAADRIEKIGDASARAILEACESTARDIEETGQLAVEIAAAIMSEAQEIASGLRTKGDRMSEHLKEFAQLAKKVSITMRDTREEVTNPAAH